MKDKYCPSCGAGITSTDIEAGFCTQCKHKFDIGLGKLTVQDLARLRTIFFSVAKYDVPMGIMPGLWSKFEKRIVAEVYEHPGSIQSSQTGA